MKTNREILSDIEFALLKRPLNDRERKQKLIEDLRRDREKMTSDIRNQLIYENSLDRYRMSKMLIERI